MAGEEGALAADPPVALRLRGLGRHGDLVELADRPHAVVVGDGEIRRDQRAHHGQPAAGLGRHRGRGLPRLRRIARGQPFAGALQFIEIPIGARLRRELAVGARGFRVPAFLHQTLGERLPRDRGLGRVDEAARAYAQREREDCAQRRPWTSRDRCHTLHPFPFAKWRRL